MVVLPLLACLDQLRLIDCKIICFGDWDQLGSVSPSWCGVPVDPHAFRHSRLYKWWSDRTKFVLQRCRRSDQGHFDFYTSLSMHLPHATAASRRKYGTTNDDADLHLTISHKRRRAISVLNSPRPRSVRNVSQCLWVTIPPISALSALA